MGHPIDTRVVFRSTVEIAKELKARYGWNVKNQQVNQYLKRAEKKIYKALRAMVEAESRGVHRSDIAR